MAVKCLVKGCQNHQGEGGFVGDLCSPCHRMITQGLVDEHGLTFIHALAKKLLAIKYLVDDIWIA
jgi:hypothetical protein